MDAALLRWWDGASWTQQTMPAAPAAVEPAPTTAPVAPVTPIAPAATVEDGPGIYIPRNSVFKMAEAVDGQAYVPEWSGIADISDEVALSGVPVQLALTATVDSGPPIPVSADAFPILGVAPEAPTPEPVAPAWQVEQPLAKPIDQLFPVSGPASPALPVPPLPPTLPAPAPAAAFSIAVAHPPVVDVPVLLPEPAASGPVLSPDIFPSAAPAGALSAAPPPTGALFPGLVPDAPEPVAEQAPVVVPVLAAVPDLVEIAEPAPLEHAVVAAEAPVVVEEPVIVEAPVVVEAPVRAAPLAEPVMIPQAVPVIPVLAPAPPFAVPEPEQAPEPELPPAALAPAALEPVAPQPVAPQPVALEPVAPQPVAPQPVPAQPVAAPAPEVAPVAAATSEVGYEPLVARAIPQPVQLEAPAPAFTTAPVAESPSIAAPDAPVAPEYQPAATETPWPTEGTYQPHPGNYVPFDPTAVRIEEHVPVIPFSSRDPFNPASTSRPDLRSYGSAPVGPSGSTYTPALIVILLTPLLIAGGYALLFQLNTINVGLAPNLALAGLLVALLFVGIGAAQFDRNALAKRGYFDLASPFWILLTPLVYLGVRASRLHSQGSGGIRAVFLWFAAWAGAAAILAFSTFAAITAVTPDRIAQTEQAVSQKFVLDNVAPTVDCPSIPSFASGTVFNCTATAGSTVQLVQVTITDWLGDQSYQLISTTTTPAATAPAP